MGETVYAGLADSARQQLQCGYLSLFGIPLSGPMLIRMQPRTRSKPACCTCRAIPTSPCASTLRCRLQPPRSRSCCARGRTRLLQPLRQPCRTAAFRCPPARHPLSALPVRRTASDAPGAGEGQAFQLDQARLPRPHRSMAGNPGPQRAPGTELHPWAKDAFVERARTRSNSAWPTPRPLPYPWRSAMPRPSWPASSSGWASG
jgi:hypothetical protein